MGMWPTATLTYGYDITCEGVEWIECDEPDEEARQILKAAGIDLENINVHQDYDHGLRLTAAFLQASGWKSRATADALAPPDGADEDLRRAAGILGIDLADTKPYWLLTARFD